MKKRIITAVICTLAFIPFLYFSNTIAFPISMGFGCFMGVREMLRCLGEKNWFIKIPSLLMAAGLPILARTYGDYYGDKEVFLGFAHKVFVVYLFCLLVVAVFSKGKRDISHMAMLFVTVNLIIYGFSSIVLLRDYEHGVWIYMLVFICPWMTDIFAYFTGYFFGKHKLIPDVSPKKTVEGAVGGTIFCTLSLLGYAFVLDYFNFIEANVNYIAFICVGLLLSIVSQCGDLIFSLIKRKYGIKDYGNFMPGHGGVLDRFDSVITSAPFVLMMFDLSGIFRMFS